MKLHSLASLAALSVLTATPAMAQSPGHENAPISLESGNWRMTFGGFARTVLTVGNISHSSDDIQFGPEPGPSDYIGFANLNARLNFDVSYRDIVSARISLDGAGGIDTINGSTDGAIQLKDAYMDFDIVPAFQIRAGQFKPPIDFENLTSETKSDFIERSVVSTGMTVPIEKTEEDPESISLRGISPARELGIQFDSDLLDFGSVGFRYAAAVTSGSGTETGPIDTRAALYAHLELALMNALYDGIKPGHFFSIGVSAAYRHGKFKFPSSATIIGGVPDVLANYSYYQNITTITGELHANYSGLHIDVEAFWNKISNEENEHSDIAGISSIPDDESAYGIVAQISYMLPFEYFRFQFGYRYALIVPDTDNGVDQHTVSVAYFVENYPVSVRFDYTVNVEANVGFDNDFAMLMAQFVW